jgi:hypothetical protein
MYEVERSRHRHSPLSLQLTKGALRIGVHRLVDHLSSSAKSRDCCYTRSHQDTNWLARYASYMVAEQAGTTCRRDPISRSK